MRSREQARAFVKEFDIDWPTAYGVEALKSAAPVIYVIGTDGHVEWSDERTRIRHNIRNLRSDLETAINRALERRSGEAPAEDLQIGYRSHITGG
ncbi:MAG TPA: hypothetical protein VHC22_31235 [Pirellulales bacterium]|nr:hypothetical protein [Pirellulales bacterium]